jgi:hypothetical protein
MPEPSSLHCITEFSRQNWVLGVHTMVRQLAVVPEARQYWVSLHVCTVVNTRPSDEHCCTFFASQVWWLGVQIMSTQAPSWHA